VERPAADSQASPDERLLRDFLAGQEDAFAELVERYSRELYIFVTRFVRNPAVAEDVVQETFVQVYQSAGGFDLSRRFRPWLYTIAANKARDHLRERQRKREITIGAGAVRTDAGESSYLDYLADDESPPDAKLAAEEQRNIVRAIIDTLPANLREILLLGYFQRLPYKEIAEVLSIPLGTVKSRLHAAVSAFADAYQKAQTTGTHGRRKE
jgi:RNA polymerase sigma-70 factor (ECF subfamily)